MDPEALRKAAQEKLEKEQREKEEAEAKELAAKEAREAERLAQMEGGGGSKKKKKREKKKDTDVSVKTSWFDNHFEDYADGISFPNAYV